MLRRAATLLLAAAIGMLPIAPPEHVHDAVDHDGHHATVAHRHADAHGHPRVGAHPHPTDAHAGERAPVAHPRLGGHPGDHDIAVVGHALEATSHAFDASRPTLDDEESVVATSGAVWTIPGAPSLDMPASLVAPAWTAPPDAAPRASREASVEPLIHGPPPSPASPRAPPVPARL